LGRTKRVSNIDQIKTRPEAKQLRHITANRREPSESGAYNYLTILDPRFATMESSRGPPRVKNKAAAPVQISAEQLLREAVDRQEVALQKPTQRFADLEELKEYQGRKRREFEDYVRRNRVRLHNWLQYAQWELEQKEFARARSVFERALDVHPNNTRKTLPSLPKTN